MANRAAGSLWAAAACAATFACATDPAGERDFLDGVPLARIHDSIREEGVSYRELVEDDFAAPYLPRHLDRRNVHTAARLCGAISGPANLDVEITVMRGEYTARVLDPAYRAYLNPRCSWLDPKLDRKEKRWALDHEQVHFTLLEIEARKLNRAIAALEIDVPSPNEAAPLAKLAVDRLLDAARSRYLERSRRLDAEASHPSEQRELDRWAQTTLRELEALPVVD